MQKIHYFAHQPANDTNSTLNSFNGTIPHVLLVEDNFSQQQMFVEVLTANGLDVTCVGHPLGALSILQSSSKIDLLVADIGLSAEMDGADLAHQALKYRPQLPVLLITGFGPERLQQAKYISLDAATMFKPFSLDEFVRQAKQTIRYRSICDSFRL